MDDATLPRLTFRTLLQTVAVSADCAVRLEAGARFGQPAPATMATSTSATSPHNAMAEKLAALRRTLADAERAAAAAAAAGRSRAKRKRSLPPARDFRRQSDAENP